MAKDRCRYHPNLFSSGVCRQCGIPLCDACKILRAEGIFCSGECWDKYVKFQQRISAHRSVRGGILPALTGKKALILIALIVVLVFFLHFFYDVDTPGDVPRAIVDMFKDLAGLFR